MASNGDAQIMKIVDPTGLVLFGLGFCAVCVGLVVMYGGLGILLGLGKP